MVEIWSWIIGYAVLFAVVQLVIYAYYVRHSEGTASATGTRDGDEYHAVGDPLDRDTDVDRDFDSTSTSSDSTHHRCPHCGTPNKSVGTIRYCRNCTESLG